MTKLTLKNAFIAAQSRGDGVYKITLICRQKDVAGEICDVTNLEVQIKGEENGHRD